MQESANAQDKLANSPPLVFPAPHAYRRQSLPKALARGILAKTLMNMEIWKSFRGFFKKDGPRGDLNDGPKSLDVIRHEARKNSMDWLANKPSEYAQELRLNETVSKLKQLAGELGNLKGSESAKIAEDLKSISEKFQGNIDKGKLEESNELRVLDLGRLKKLEAAPGLKDIASQIINLVQELQNPNLPEQSNLERYLEDKASQIINLASELQKQAPTLEKEVLKLDKEDKQAKLEKDQGKFQKQGRDAKDALEWLAEIQTEMDLGLFSNDKEPPSLAQHLGFADDKNDATGKEKNEPATKISLDGRKDGLRVYQKNEDGSYLVTNKDKDKDSKYTHIKNEKLDLKVILGENLKWDLPKIQVVSTKQEYDIEMKKKVWGIVDGGRKKKVLFTDKQEEASRLIKNGDWEDINYVSAAKEDVTKEDVTKEDVTKEDGAEKIKKLDIESLKTFLYAELNQKLADIKISDVQYASKVKTDITLNRDTIKIYKAGDIYIASCGDLSGDVYRKRNGQIMKPAVGANELPEGATKLEQFTEVPVDDIVSPDQVQWILPPLKVVQQNSEFILTNRNIENEKEFFEKVLTGTVKQIIDRAKLLLDNACDQAHNAVEQKIKEQKENLHNELKGIWNDATVLNSLKTSLGVGEDVKVNFTVDPNMANSGIWFYENDTRNQIYVSSRSDLKRDNSSSDMIYIDGEGNICTEVTDGYEELQRMQPQNKKKDSNEVKWILPQLHVLVKLEDNKNGEGDSGNKILEVVLTDNEYACNMKEYKGYGEIAKTAVFAGGLDQMRRKAKEVLDKAPKDIIEHARALNKFTEDISRGFCTKVLQDAYNDLNMTDQRFQSSLNLYTDINKISFGGDLTVKDFFDEKKEINSIMIDNCKTSFLEILSKCASLDPIYKQLRGGVTFDSIEDFKGKCEWKLENATAEGMNCLLDSMRQLYASKEINDNTFLGKLSRKDFKAVREDISGKLDEKVKASIQAIQDNASKIGTDQSFSEDNKKFVINAIKTLVGSTGQTDLTGSTVLKDIAKLCCDKVENEDNMENEISQAIISIIRKSEKSAQSIDNLLSEHKVDFSELSMLLKSQYNVVNNKMLNLGHPDGKALLELFYGDERVKGNGLLLYTWSDNDDKQGGKIRCSEMKPTDGKETKAVFLNQQINHFSPMAKVRQAS